MTLWLTVGALALAAAGCSPDWTGGIHARMGWSETTGLRVVEVPRDGPAAEAGIREGDRITSIDGDDVQGLPVRDVVEHLRGPVGSHVELGILRRGERLTLRVERAPYTEASAEPEE
jgi:carboxyl-terminal processing protease